MEPLIPGNPNRRYIEMPRFTQADVSRAATEWGLNCGPAAVAAVCGLTLDELRPHLGDFEQKGHTTPTLMWQILGNLQRARLIGGLWIRSMGSGTLPWPLYGLARIQWEGPWTAPGVPVRARYPRSHWIGCAWIDDDTSIFDVNCMSVGGWVRLGVWSECVVPWILKECVPRANGLWHVTHAVEIERPK